MRYLAPWKQEDLIAALEGRPAGRELDTEALAALRGKPAIYHCISRVVDRRFAFETREKEKFVALMRCYEEFSQVRVLAFCVMSNHFHILLEVPSPPAARGQDWSDERFLDHLSCLYSERRLAEIRWQLDLFRQQKADAAAEAYRESFFVRMWDLSQFMKSLKQCFSRWFNTVHERRGTLWEERFKSVLVEDGHAARVVAAYIDLNPVRARIVEDPKDYRWSSYGEATGGRQRAREGIQRVMFESTSAWSSEEKAAEVLTDWRESAGRYRKVLFAHLGRGSNGETHDGSPSTDVEVIIEHVRQFNDGLAVGKKEFLDDTFQLSRDRFGPNRKSGARKIRGIRTDLTAMRDLDANPSTLSTTSSV